MRTVPSPRLVVVAGSVPFCYTAITIYIWDRDMGVRENMLAYWMLNPTLFHRRHLIENYEGSIQKASALLKPGGVFGTRTVCLSPGSRLLRSVLPAGALQG